MKKTVMALALILFAMPVLAQDKLLLIDPETLELYKENPKLNFYSKEIDRLLIPEGTLFGMIRTSSSFFPESVLSYDPKAQKLFYKGVKTQIWKAMSQPFEQNDMSLYQAPDVWTCVLKVTDFQARQLETLWRHAIETSADIPDNMLDGSTWKFFMGDRQAKARHFENPLVQFATQIAYAVSDSDAVRLDFIITCALDKTLERMDRLPAEEDPTLSEQCQRVDTLIIVDGKVQPQSLNFICEQKAATEYFAKQKRKIYNTTSHFRPLMLRDMAEQYGIIARKVIEYSTVPL
jgi:hypothetical protein